MLTKDAIERRKVTSTESREGCGCGRRRGIMSVRPQTREKMSTNNPKHVIHQIVWAPLDVCAVWSVFCRRAVRFAVHLILSARAYNSYPQTRKRTNSMECTSRLSFPSDPPARLLLPSASHSMHLLCGRHTGNSSNVILGSSILPATYHLSMPHRSLFLSLILPPSPRLALPRRHMPSSFSSKCSVDATTCSSQQRE